MLEVNSVYCMDYLDLLGQLEAQSVDAIITDPPYAMTNLDFEIEVKWRDFWDLTRRALKSTNSPVVIFSQQPFTTDLIMSNRKAWRYEIVWEKTMPVGFLDANRRPMRCHENIEVFGDTMPLYIPQMEVAQNTITTIIRKDDRVSHYNKHRKSGRYQDNGTRFPRSVLKHTQPNTPFHNNGIKHPTQKPLALMRYLVQTYTREGDLVVDPFCGSGTTLRAAQELGRRYIGGDITPEYVTIANKRLAMPYNVLLPGME